MNCQDRLGTSIGKLSQPIVNLTSHNYKGFMMAQDRRQTEESIGFAVDDITVQCLSWKVDAIKVHRSPQDYNNCCGVNPGQTMT